MSFAGSPRRSGAVLTLVLALAAGALAPVRAQSGRVEQVIPQGLARMSQDAFLHAFGVRPGDPYDRDAVVAAFRRLWDLGLFETIVIETETGPQGGTVLVVKVEERPVLAAVEYEENKVLTQTQIEDRLKERKVSLDLGKPISMKAVLGAEGVIRDYLAEKGYLTADVGHEIRDVTTASRAVSYRIRPGGKTRIGRIDFTGNTVLSDRRLKRELKLNQPRRWWWPWTPKNLYHPIKWEQDAGAIRDLYQNEGYLDVQVRTPVVETHREVVKQGRRRGRGSRAAAPAAASTSATSVPASPEATAVEEARAAGGPQGTRAERRAAKKAAKARERQAKAERRAQPTVKRLVTLTVPIVEGPQYRLGEITTSGNKVLVDQQIIAAVPLRRGDVLRDGALKRAAEAVTRAYNDRGYLYASAVRQIRRREGEPVADVTLAVTEGEPYYVGRIEFRGNTSTHDRVLRRELLLREGELFSRSKLDLSKYKINQLGYFEVKDEPQIEPLEGENRVAITIGGEEKGRNEVQIGGGYSGIDGAFFQGYYSTRNFLGRGQVLTTSVQVGGRANRYTISFLEPWFLNRPYSLGASIFRRDVEYGSSFSGSSLGSSALRSVSEGVELTFGRRLGRFSRARLNYRFQDVVSTQVLTSTDPPLRSEYRLSGILPQYQLDRIDDPYRPRRGWQFTAQSQVYGDALGGDTAILKPELLYTGYRKAFGRTLFALHVEGGLVREWGEGSRPRTSNVFGVPAFERFFIGGDTQGPRVFETRTITPRRFVRRDASGVIVEAIRDPRGRDIRDFDTNGNGVLDAGDYLELGGDRFFLVQSEYVIPFGGPAELALFVDAGNAIFEDDSWGFEDTRVSAGVELRFYLPVFPVPLRLIYGVPIRELPGDRTTGFTFSIGRSF